MTNLVHVMLGTLKGSCVYDKRIKSKFKYKY